MLVPPAIDAADRRAVASQRIHAACYHVVAGKLATRDLAAWARPFGVSESEFRLLWVMAQPDWFGGEVCPRNQVELAERLAVSAAQVSAVVERLRLRGLIEAVRDDSDRRRQLWRVTKTGEKLVSQVVATLSRPTTGVAAIPPLTPPLEEGECAREAA